MPITTTRHRPPLVPFLALTMLPVAAAGAAWTPADPGTEACGDAAAAGDLAAARKHCVTDGPRANPVDAFNLALLLFEPDPPQARALLRSAADAGLAEADQVLGNLLLDEGETAAGLERLERAARAGLALAQYDLATALLEQGGENAASEAARWYGWAAAGGDDAARYNLGVLLLSGRAGAPRPLWAWAWLSSIEAMEGHDEVRRLTSELSEQMDAEERERAHEFLARVRRDPAAAAAAAVAS